MHKVRYDFYANEFLVPDQTGHGGSNKDLPGLLGRGRGMPVHHNDRGGINRSAGSGSLSSHAGSDDMYWHEANKTAANCKFLAAASMSGDQTSFLGAAAHCASNATAGQGRGSVSKQENGANCGPSMPSSSHQGAMSSRCREVRSLPSEGKVSNNSSSSGKDGDFDWRTARPCPEFLSVSLFRPAAPRLASHLANIQKEYASFYGEEILSLHFDEQDPEHWLRLAPSVIDNYVVRCLLGRSVFFLPVGALHSDHQTAAMLVVLQIEVVLTLGDGELSGSIFKLGESFG